MIILHFIKSRSLHSSLSVYIREYSPVHQNIDTSHKLQSSHVNSVDKWIFPLSSPCNICPLVQVGNRSKVNCTNNVSVNQKRGAQINRLGIGLVCKHCIIVVLLEKPVFYLPRDQNSVVDLGQIQHIQMPPCASHQTFRLDTSCPDVSMDIPSNYLDCHYMMCHPYCT